MLTKELQVDTMGRAFVDLTQEVALFCREATDGLCNIFVPHATAGIVVFETGAGSEQDLKDFIHRLLPRDDSYVHRHGSKGHGADHLLPALLSASLVVPVVAGEVTLGVWQHIVLVDLNPDNSPRKVRLSLIEG